VKLVSREDWIDIDKTAYDKKIIEVNDFHYKTSYYDKKGNLFGFYESFSNTISEMVSIYFIV
jgi:hypothetical protein